MGYVCVGGGGVIMSHPLLSLITSVSSCPCAIVFLFDSVVFVLYNASTSTAVALPPSLPPSLSLSLFLSQILYSHERRCVIGLAVSADLRMCVLKSVYIDSILAKKSSAK
jgi:hypothetical protein